MIRTLLSVVALGAVLGATATAQAPASSNTPKATKMVDRASKPPVVVNLNTATVAELQELPGIGAKTAARIVDYRQKKGPFKKIEELMNVQGIGEKSFLKLRSQITVGGKPDASGQQ